MSSRVSVANHNAGGRRMLAEVFCVDICGQVLDTPRLSQYVAPGVTTLIELRSGDVLTLRDDPEAEGDDEGGKGGRA